MNKHGEMTTQQIVGLIILIASFAVILFLLFRLNIGETSDEQICHNSVVLKSKGGLVGGKLDCKTSYVCISGGDDCEGISSTKIVKIDLSESDASREIMDAIAEELAVCWWMFGEGKLSYASSGSVCAICSVIGFDRKILDVAGEDESFLISYRDFYEYLNSVNKTEGQSFFNYLYGFYDVDKFQEKGSSLNVDLDSAFILDDSRFVVLTGMKKGFTGFSSFYSYYLKSSQISDLDFKCDSFVTDA